MKQTNKPHNPAINMNNNSEFEAWSPRQAMTIIQNYVNSAGELPFFGEKTDTDYRFKISQGMQLLKHCKLKLASIYLKFNFLVLSCKSADFKYMTSFLL